MDKKTSNQVNDLIIREKHLTNGEISEIVHNELGVVIKADSIRQRRKRLGLGKSPDTRQDGTSIYTINTFGEELEQNQFEPHNWSYGWLKTDRASIFIRNEKDLVSYEMVRDELIADMKKHAPKYPKLRRVSQYEHLAVIDAADVHMGKLCARPEVPTDYNMEVASKRFQEGIEGCLQKCLSHNMTHCVFVIGNDILHTDNPFRTTTSGTKQDTDGMWWQNFQAAKAIMVNAIELLIQHSNVHLVYCPSNHDFASGYMLADAIVSWFHNCDRVTADSPIIHRKYVQYGKNLLGFTHGDGVKNAELQHQMPFEAKKAWAETEWGYWYVHHVHHKDRKAHGKKVHEIEKDKVGMTIIHQGMGLDPSHHIHVEHVRSPSPPDRWHYTNGFTNLQAVEAFMHHPYEGQVARFTHFF